MIRKLIFIIFLFFICGHLLAGDLSTSEKMLNKFRNVSTELHLNILKLAETDNELDKSWLGEIEGKTLKQKAEKLTSEIMEQWGNAFVLPDPAAFKLLSGEYNNEKNRQDVKNCISEFAEQNVLLPFTFRHLISRFYEGKLKSGILLEFTARLFKEHLKQIKQY